jgi:4-hydroxyphenylpyruvate dioxygenase
MKPALAQVCSLGSSLEQDIEDYAAGHCQAIELWWGKVDTFLERHSPADLRNLLAAHEMAAPAISFQGGLLTSQGDYRKEHWASFTRRLPICREVGIATMIVAGDIAGPLTQPDLDRIEVSLTQAASLAAEHDVRLALEFQGRAALANNLQTAASLVSQIGSPHLGLCLDLYHYYVGPSKAEDLAYLTQTNLFHVQLCDLAGTVREMATDADRILPGDGDFLIEPVIEHLRRIGYNAYVSVELMNPQIWQIPARQFGEIAMTALRRMLGQASMGESKEQL